MPDDLERRLADGWNAIPGPDLATVEKSLAEATSSPRKAPRWRSMPRWRGWSRRGLLGSVAVASFAATIVALIIATPGQRTASPLGGDNPYYAPSFLPDGYRPCGVSVATAGSPVGPGSGDRLVVWGDLSQSDPWGGAVAVLEDRPGDGKYGQDPWRPATVAGKRASVGPTLRGSNQIVPTSWGSSVAWLDSPDHVVQLDLRGATETEVLKLAERVRRVDDKLVLPEDALGSRSGVIHDSKDAPPDPAASQFTLRYDRQAVGEGDAGDQLEVEVRDFGPNGFELATLFAIEPRDVTIQGRRGIVFARYPEGRRDAAIWEIAPGRIGRVTSLEFGTEEGALAIAESVVPVDAAAWRQLEVQGRECQAQWSDAPDPGPSTPSDPSPGGAPKNEP